VSVITEILDRLSGIEVVKEKLRDTGGRVEKLAERVVGLNEKVHELDRRMVRMETYAEVAKMQRESTRRLPRSDD
jgi:chromosome segregation ATPase